MHVASYWLASSTDSIKMACNRLAYYTAKGTYICVSYL